MNTPVSFELAKLLKEKRFDNTTSHFYTKPNSKMFGIDEHGRYYPIKNKAKSLWVVGNAAALNIENVYQAPTIADVCMWLYEKHKIWISIDPENDTDTWFHTITHGKSEIVFGNYNSPIEAYEKGIEGVLNYMI